MPFCLFGGVYDNFGLCRYLLKGLLDVQPQDNTLCSLVIDNDSLVISLPLLPPTFPPLRQPIPKPHNLHNLTPIPQREGVIVLDCEGTGRIGEFVQLSLVLEVVPEGLGQGGIHGGVLEGLPVVSGVGDRVAEEGPAEQGQQNYESAILSHVV